MKQNPSRMWGFELKSPKLTELYQLKEKDMNDPDAERTIPFEIDIQIWDERIRLAKEINLVVDSRKGILCESHPETEAAVVLKENSYNDRTYFFCPRCTLEKLESGYRWSVNDLRRDPSIKYSHVRYAEKKERLERCQTALKKGRFVAETVDDIVDMKEIGYKCHHCGLYINYKPRVVDPCSGHSTQVCWVCDQAFGVDNRGGIGVKRK
jgi:hypothetical protein